MLCNSGVQCLKLLAISQKGQVSRVTDDEVGKRMLVSIYTISYLLLTYLQPPAVGTHVPVGEHVHKLEKPGNNGVKPVSCKAHKMHETILV